MLDFIKRLLPTWPHFHRWAAWDTTPNGTRMRYCVICGKSQVKR